MKRYLTIGLLLLTLLAFVVAPVLAYVYYAAVTVTEDGTEAHDMAAVGVEVKNEWMADNSFMEASARDTRIETLGGLPKPHMVADNATWFATAVPSSSQTNLYYTTGNSLLPSLDITFGSDGYLTVSDDTTLELELHDFSLHWGGIWVDTDAGNLKRMEHKYHAIRIGTDTVTDEQINVDLFGVDTDCLDFVRANTDWVSVPDDPAFSFTDGAGNDEPFTFIAWVNLDDATNSSVLTKYLAAGNQYEWFLNFNGADQLEIRCSDPTGANDIQTTSLGLAADQGTWHQYAATYDGSELDTGFELYRDGINITNARASGGAYVGMTGGTEVVNIGSRATGTAIFMDGLMAEAKVYNAELTPAEMLADYTGEHRTDDLVAWWKIDEGYGLPQDSSGNGHNATLNLADWVDTFTERYTTETYASNVASDEYDIEVAREDEPAMALWATDVNIGVNMGQGILPVKLIEEVTLDAAAASVTFSNIDTNVALWDSLSGETTRHLVVMVNTRSTGVVNSREFYMQFNGDGGANYNSQRMYGWGAGSAGVVQTNDVQIRLFSVPAFNFAPAFGGGTTLIPYAFNTINQKATLAFGGAVEENLYASAGRWANTAAITSITLFAGGGDNLVAGSTFTLGVIDERYLVEEQLVAVAGAIDFQNIPQDGSDLVVIGYSQSDAAAVEDEIQHEINNDAHAAVYPTQEITGRGIAIAASQPNFEIGMTSGDNAVAEEFGALLATYSQYAGGTNQAHYTSLSGYHESSVPTSEVRAMSGRWGNVAAITRLEFYPATAPNQFLPGTLFSLYRVPRYVIDRQELSVATPTITFANIPQEYQALQLNIYAQSSDAIPISDEIEITINTDGLDANFDNQELEGTGAGVPTATRISGVAGSRVIMLIPAGGAGANEFGGGTVTFSRYERTDGHKHLLTLSGTQENQVILRSSRWENLAAITDIDLDPVNGVNFVIGSVFELVGLMPTQVLDIDIDGEIKGLADGNFDVEDTTDDWKWGQNNVTPYSGNYTHTVDDVTHIWYQPNYMVHTTAFSGTADAGSTAALIRDAELTQVDNYWNNARVTILTTTDTFAPVGESRVVTDFLAATDDLIVDTDFSDTVDAGDTYRVEFGAMIDRSYYGVEFDGVDPYVNCGNGASLAFVDALTIEAWVKPSTLASADPTALAIGKIDNWYFGFQQNNGFLRGRVYPAGEQTASADALVAGDWAHICLTYDGVNMNMYKNGAFVEAFAQAGLIGIGANSLNIGLGSPAPFAAFPGIVDEVRIYSRAALLAEITANYNSGQGTYTPSNTMGLVGWWHLEEGTGVAAADSSGNGNNGVLTNAPLWVNGHVPRPADNNGTNDARITWGINPTGIAVAIGSMLSVSTPTPGEDIEDPTLDILPPVDSSDWFIEPAVAGSLLTNPLRPLVTILSDTTTLTELQAWRLYALALILLVTVSTAKAVRSHQLITGIAAGATIGGVVALTIFPLWTLVFVIGAILAGIVSERTPSV